MDEKVGYHVFPSKNFGLTVPKTFVKESYCFWEKNWFEIVLWMKRGVSRFSVELFWSHSAKKFRGHPFKVSEKLGYRKNLCLIGGVTIFRRKILVSQCRKLSSQNPTVFEKKIVLKKFYGWKGGYHVSPSNYFGFTVSKTFVRESQCFWENFRFQKVLWMKTGVSRFPVGKFWSHSVEKFRGHPFEVPEKVGYRTILCIIGVLQFSVESFLSHSVEKFHGHPFKVSENLGYRKVLCLIGGITKFHQKFFVSQSRKISWAFLQCLRKLGASKNFMHTGGITFFRRKILVSQCRKISWTSVRGFRKIGVSKKFMLNKGYHNFPSKFLCLTVPKTFVKESHCFWEKFRFQKVLWMKTGESRFPVGKFWSHSAVKFGGHPFNVSENLGYRTILCIIGVSQFSVENFLSHSAEKFHGHPFNVSENLGYRTVLCIIGVSQFSVESFWSHSAEKFLGHPFNVSENLGYRKILCIIGGITSFRGNFFVSQCRKIL